MTTATEQAQSANLRYQDGRADKVYQVQLAPKDGQWVVNFQFGRTGTTLQTGTKTDKPVPYEKALAAYTRLVAEKTGKGYSPTAEGTAYAGTAHEQRATGIVPQLLNAIGDAELETLITDRWHVMQQ